MLRLGLMSYMILCDSFHILSWQPLVVIRDIYLRRASVINFVLFPFETTICNTLIAYYIVCYVHCTWEYCTKKNFGRNADKTRKQTYHFRLSEKSNPFVFHIRFYMNQNYGITILYYWSNPYCMPLELLNSIDDDIGI